MKRLLFIAGLCLTVSGIANAASIRNHSNWPITICGNVMGGTCFTVEAGKEVHGLAYGNLVSTYIYFGKVLQTDTTRLCNVSNHDITGGDYLHVYATKHNDDTVTVHCHNFTSSGDETIDTWGYITIKDKNIYVNGYKLGEGDSSADAAEQVANFLSLPASGAWWLSE